MSLLSYNRLNTEGNLDLNFLSTVFTKTSPILSSNDLGKSASSVRFFQYLYAHETVTKLNELFVA